MLSPRVKSHAALAVAGLLFGANYWIAKGLMLGFLTPMQIIFIRGLASLLLFWLAALFVKPEHVRKSDHRNFIVAAALGVAINQIFFFTGLSYTSPVDTSLIHAASPLLVLLFSAMLMHEKITSIRLAGILTGGTGAVLLILQAGSAQNSQSSLAGNALILANITAYSLYLVKIKPMMMRYSAITVMKWIFLYGFLLVIPFSLPSMTRISFVHFTTQAWMAITYVVVGTTFLAYLLTTFSLKAVSATVAGYYIYMQPVVAGVIGILFFGETVGPVKILAGAAVFTGIYLVNRRPVSKTDA